MPPSRKRQTAPEQPEASAGRPEQAATTTRPADGPVWVRLLVSVAGPDTAWAPGEVVEMTPDQATVWCDGERAERAEDA